MPGTTASSGDSVLRAPGFARLWLAACCSEAAEWILQIALPVLVYQLTGSAASTAVMMIVGLLPAVLASPLAGVLADRWNRRLLLCAVSLGQAVVAAPLLLANGSNALPLAYVVMTAQATLAALFEPARDAMVPELVGTDRVSAANGLLSSGSNIARLAGASLGGVVFATGGLGLVYASYLGALLIAIVALAGRFGAREAPSAASHPMVRAWLDGLRAIRRDPVLRSAGMVLALMSVSQGFFLVLFVTFVLDQLHGGAGDVGLLRGVQAIGGLVAGMAIATALRRVRPVMLLGWGNVSFGLITAFGWNASLFTTHMSVYIGLFTLVGVPAVAVLSGLLSVVQTASPPESRGRVMSTTFGATALCTAVGMGIAGVAADLVGLLPLLDVQAGLYLLAGVLALTVLASRLGRRAPAATTARARPSTLAR